MNPIRLIVTVLWGFFGLRGGEQHRRDLQQVRPIPLIVTGVMLAAALVGGLAMLANWAVSHA